MRRNTSRILVFCLMVFLCCSYAGAETNEVDMMLYQDPPETEWLYTLRVYWEWNTGDFEEQPGYVLDQEGILEEGYREDPNVLEERSRLESEGVEIIDLDDPPPGGAYFDFCGVAPGDVTLKMQTTKNGELLDERIYAIRVYEDLRLAVLGSKHLSYR